MYSKRTAIIILSITLLVTGWLGYRASLSGFDYEFEKFFPQGDNETQYFEEFRKSFENDYDYLLIAIENNQGVFEPQFLQKVDSLTQELKSLNYVTEVISPTELKLPVVTGLGIQWRKVLHPDDSLLLRKDEQKIYESKEWIGSFFSEDKKAIALVLKNEEKLSKKKSDELIEGIEKSIGSYHFEATHLAGKLKAQQVYLMRMQREIILFLVVAIVLVIITLAVTFRSLWGVIFPILIVLFSIIWQLGIMQLLGKKIDVLQVLVPTILFVVGMSDVIHILSKYVEELRYGTSKTEAIRRSMKDVGLATFLTSFTTAVGFFTLITAQIMPIRDFGVYTSIGVMVAFFLTIIMMPAIMVLAPLPKISKDKKASEKWHKFLTGNFRFVIRYRKAIFWGFGIITVVCLSVIPRIKVNNFLLEDLRPHEPLKKEFMFFEKKFSGGRPFEMLIESKNTDQKLFRSDVIYEIQKLELLAKKHFDLGFIQSPVSMVKFFNRAQNSGLNNYFKVPVKKNELDSILYRMELSGFLEMEQSRLFVDESQTKARISAKMDDLGSYVVNNMEKEFLKEAYQQIDTSIISFQLTGSARLVDKNISSLSVNMVKGLGVAFLIIALCFGLLFKSLRMIVIALIPNVIPLIVIAGIMGFTGIDLKVSTSIIFTIAFGIAVDDTIHFLSRYKIELNKNKSKLYAIKRTFMSTGRAMILTSIVLCMGFIAMVTSGFLSIFYMGFLISITLLIALLADLYLLPLLLIYFTKK
jgi:predicted RND superfamily exporter protein